MGHHYLLDCTDLDDLVEKAVQSGHATAVFDLFKYHRAIHYYPHPSITEDVLKALEDFASFKAFSKIINRQ